MPKYSIIVPVYRVEAYLPACIDSVLAQTADVSFELILVDDGSPDGCGKTCDDYAAKDSRIRVLHTENRGVSRARNYGVAHAQGEYLLFLDADDEWEKELLQNVEKLTDSSPDMVMFGCSQLFESQQKVPLPIPAVAKGETGEAFLNSLFEKGKVPWYFCWSYVYSRAFFLAHQLFFPEELKVSEDFVQIMNAIPLAKRVMGCDKPLYLYRMRQGSATSSVTAEKLMNNLTTKAAYFRKYPVAAMANLYANNALLIAKAPKQDAGEAVSFLRENRDIWHHVSEAPLKVGRVLVFCFGDYWGAVIFRLLRKAVHYAYNR